MFFFEKSDIHRPYGGAKRSGTSKKRHPSPLWRQKKAQDQKKATSIALMETPNCAGPEESDIHCPNGDTKLRRNRRKRHPSPLWRHKKVQDQQKASSISLMETQKEAEPAKSYIHCPYGDTKRRRIRKMRHPQPLWRHKKAEGPEKSVIHHPYGGARRSHVRKFCLQLTPKNDCQS